MIQEKDFKWKIQHTNNIPTNPVECEFCMDGNYRRTVYTPLTFSNLILTADGTVQLEYENGLNAVFQTSPEGVEEHLEKEYTIEEVYIEF